MTIKDLEGRTGLSRANIRFYEKEDLLSPMRRYWRTKNLCRRIRGADYLPDCLTKGCIKSYGG